MANSCDLSYTFHSSGRVGFCEEIKYEGKKVHSITAKSGNVSLKRTEVTGSVIAGDWIFAEHSMAKDMRAGGLITLITSAVFNKIKVGGPFTAIGCPKLGAIDAEKCVTLVNCCYVCSIDRAQIVELKKTHVQGDVTATGKLNVVDSRIFGKLTCTAENLTIEGSIIKTIVLKCPSTGESGRRAQTLGAEGAPGTSSESAALNGVPLSELMQLGCASSEGPVACKQILTLINCAVTDVIFEGGDGEVVLLEGSSVKGTITGGVLKQ